VEVKRPRNPDQYFYVEEEHDPGCTGKFQPSGITITKAHAWAVVLGDTNMVVVIPVARIREMLNHRLTRDKQCVVGNCPTKGKLINLVACLFY
jgi:hypothetical protein